MINDMEYYREKDAREDAFIKAWYEDEEWINNNNNNVSKANRVSEVNNDYEEAKIRKTGTTNKTNWDTYIGSR